MKCLFLIVIFVFIPIAFGSEHGLNNLNLPKSHDEFSLENNDSFFDVFCPCSSFDKSLVNEAKELTFKEISKDKKAILAASFLKPFVLSGKKTIEERREKFQNATSSAHMQSTNKMGNTPESSVVDHQFRVWNYSNFFIVDGSLFPTSVGANPMQSIYTMGKIFADTIPAK